MHSPFSFTPLLLPFTKKRMPNPGYLNPGDLIAVVAPAGKVLPEQVVPAIDWLERNGFKVLTGRHLLSSEFQFAGKDTERTDDLQEALDHPEVKAIIFARGGYGTIRIVESISFEGLLKYPKWLVGFSDITILHNISANLAIPTIHGPMMRGFLEKDGQPAESLIRLMQVLKGHQAAIHFESMIPNQTGQATGILAGGNLSLIYSLLGTPYDLDTRDKILFIEDIGEYLYHIDRMMISLRLAGKLKNLKGLIVGQFTGLKDNDDPFGKTVEEIIRESTRGYDYPIGFGCPSGHGSPNYPLVLGMPCTMKAEWNQTTLSFENPSA
jgi:muramoyltetrapeptide carboxypeptidase